MRSGSNAEPPTRFLSWAPRRWATLCLHSTSWCLKGFPWFAGIPAVLTQESGTCCSNCHGKLGSSVSHDSHEPLAIDHQSCMSCSNTQPRCTRRDESIDGTRVVRKCVLGLAKTLQRIEGILWESRAPGMLATLWERACKSSFFQRNGKCSGATTSTRKNAAPRTPERNL